MTNFTIQMKTGSGSDKRTTKTAEDAIDVNEAATKAVGVID